MAEEKEYHDIPGTFVFDTDAARRGYWLNQFGMSLMKAENRDKFHADEKAYLAEWPMTDEQRQAVLDRDYNKMLSLGGNIFFLIKIAASEGKSFQHMAAIMTGMKQEDYAEMMLKGGRSPVGARYKSEWNKGG
jgi:protocatechuate 4,5-dioxygenase alpha chain